MSEIRKILERTDIVYRIETNKEGTLFYPQPSTGPINSFLDEAEKEIMAWHTAEVKRIIGPYEYGQSPALDPKEEYYIGRDNLRDEILKRAGLDTLPEGGK